MKKIISISLSIFLVMGAMVLVTGGTQANAGPISNLYAGNWVSYAVSEHGDNPYIDTDYSIGRQVISSDGTMVTTLWGLADIQKTEWTPSRVDVIVSTQTFTNMTENRSGGYVSYSNSFIDEHEVTVTMEGRCYGMFKTSIGFTEMQCLTKVTLKGGPNDLDVQNVNTSISKRENRYRP